MKFEYDKESDAAYIYLKYPVKDGEAKSTRKLSENIVLDFDKENKLLGVEILDASKVLCKISFSTSVFHWWFYIRTNIVWKMRTKKPTRARRRAYHQSIDWWWSVFFDKFYSTLRRRKISVISKTS